MHIIGAHRRDVGSPASEQINSRDIPVLISDNASRTYWQQIKAAPDLPK